jgi:hypothetical protein
MWFITRPIARSLPGICRAEKTTVSSRSRGHADDIGGLVVPHVAVANLHPARDAQIAQLLRDLRVALDAAADKGDLALELRREIDHDLHPVDARREGRHHDHAGRAGEDLLEGVDDVDLRSGEALTIDVGAVAEQGQHALPAELGEAMEVEQLPVDRRLVDLEVAGVDEHAERRVDGEPDAVRHAVRDAQELDLERADLDDVLRLHERGDAALLQVGEVGNDEVDAEELDVGERHPGVDDETRVPERNRHEIHAEFAEAAQRDDFKSRVAGERVAVPGMGARHRSSLHGAAGGGWICPSPVLAYARRRHTNERRRGALAGSRDGARGDTTAGLGAGIASDRAAGTVRRRGKPRKL